MKFETTRPSSTCMRGPYVLKMRATCTEQPERLRDVPTAHREARGVAQMFDVARRARDEVVEAEHRMAAHQQLLAQVRAEKTRAARYDDGTWWYRSHRISFDRPGA